MAARPPPLGDVLAASAPSAKYRNAAATATTLESPQRERERERAPKIEGGGGNAQQLANSSQWGTDLAAFALPEATATAPQQPLAFPSAGGNGNGNGSRTPRTPPAGNGNGTTESWRLSRSALGKSAAASPSPSPQVLSVLQQLLELSASSPSEQEALLKSIARLSNSAASGSDGLPLPLPAGARAERAAMGQLAVPAAYLPWSSHQRQPSRRHPGVEAQLAQLVPWQMAQQPQWKSPSQPEPWENLSTECPSPDGQDLVHQACGAVMRLTPYVSTHDAMLKSLRRLLQGDPGFLKTWDCPKSHLATAVWEGHIGLARTLLRSGAEANESDGSGVRLLHVAAAGAAPEMARLLLAARALANVRDRWGRTPLSVARSVETCKHLFEWRAEMGKLNDQGQSVLHLQGRDGPSDVFRFLASRASKALLTMRDEHGFTAHHYAEEAVAIRGACGELEEYNASQMNQSRLQALDTQVELTRVAVSSSEEMTEVKLRSSLETSRIRDRCTEELSFLRVETEEEVSFLQRESAEELEMLQRASVQEVGTMHSQHTTQLRELEEEADEEIFTLETESLEATATLEAQSARELSALRSASQFEIQELQQERNAETNRLHRERRDAGAKLEVQAAGALGRLQALSAEEVAAVGEDRDEEVSMLQDACIMEVEELEADEREAAARLEVQSAIELFAVQTASQRASELLEMQSAGVLGSCQEASAGATAGLEAQWALQQSMFEIRAEEAAAALESRAGAEVTALQESRLEEACQLMADKAVELALFKAAACDEVQILREAAEQQHESLLEKLECQQRSAETVQGRSEEEFATVLSHTQASEAAALERLGTLVTQQARNLEERAGEQEQAASDKYRDLQIWMEANQRKSEEEFAQVVANVQTAEAEEVVLLKLAASKEVYMLREAAEEQKRAAHHRFEQHRAIAERRREQATEELSELGASKDNSQAEELATVKANAWTEVCMLEDMAEEQEQAYQEYMEEHHASSERERERASQELEHVMASAKSSEAALELHSESEAKELTEEAELREAKLRRCGEASDAEAKHRVAELELELETANREVGLLSNSLGNTNQEKVGARSEAAELAAEVWRLSQALTEARHESYVAKQERDQETTANDLLKLDLDRHSALAEQELAAARKERQVLSTEVQRLKTYASAVDAIRRERDELQAENTRLRRGGRPAEPASSGASGAAGRGRPPAARPPAGPKSKASPKP